MKQIFLAQLAPTDEYVDYLLVLARQQRTTKTNKPYLSLTLADKTGQVEARVWDVSDKRIEPFEKGDVVKIQASASTFEGRMQLKIERIRKARPDERATEVSMSDLLPSTTQDVEHLWTVLEGFIAGFTDPDLKRLVEAVLAEPGIALSLREAPAAKSLHHAWIGGLLEHIVSLLQLADRVVPHYPIVYRDLVLTGVILHDIGKLKELSWAAGFEYTLEGQMLGHIQIGASLVEHAMDALPDFPPRLKMLVLHTILSHHGKLEFGSPKLPMIPEALMLHYLDDLDAKMQTVASEFEKSVKQGRAADELTDRVWALDQRQMLNTRAWLATGEAEAEPEDISEKQGEDGYEQGTLFVQD